MRPALGPKEMMSPSDFSSAPERCQALTLLANIESTYRGMIHISRQCVLVDDIQLQLSGRQSLSAISNVPRKSQGHLPAPTTTTLMPVG